MYLPTLQIIISCMLLVSTLFFSAESMAQAKPGCKSKCGNVTIAYPFGIGSGCYFDWYEDDVQHLYDIRCNTSYNPPKPFTLIGNHEILSISGTEVIIKNTHISVECFDKKFTLETVMLEISPPLNFIGTLFTISYAKNRFVGVGCDTLVSISDNSCRSRCDRRADVVEGSCTGHGCCQGNINKGIKIVHVGLEANIDRHESVDDPPDLNRTYLNTCHIGFLVEIKQYTFRTSDLFMDGRLVRNKAIIPVVLDWSIRDRTCEDAQLTAFQEAQLGRVPLSDTYACQSNTFCTDAINSPGYSCTCKKGYEGNPYLTPGCKDVDECDEHHYENPCYGICTNTNGGYNCSACPEGRFGDGRKDGNGCTIIDKNKCPIISVALGVGLGFLFVVASCSCFFLGVRKRKLNKLKGRFFKQNGGLLLKQQLGSKEAVELESATHKYNESQVLGRGKYGTVYRGTISE